VAHAAEAEKRKPSGTGKPGLGESRARKKAQQEPRNARKSPRATKKTRAIGTTRVRKKKERQRAR